MFSGLMILHFSIRFTLAESFLTDRFIYQKAGLAQIPLGLVGIIAAGFMISKYGFDYPVNADIAKVVSNIIIICLSGITLISEIKIHLFRTVFFG
jgi:hypothetical protein